MSRARARPGPAAIGTNAPCAAAHRCGTVAAETATISITSWGAHYMRSRVTTALAGAALLLTAGIASPVVADTTPPAPVRCEGPGLGYYQGGAWVSGPTIPNGFQIGYDITPVGECPHHQQVTIVVTPLDGGVRPDPVVQQGLVAQARFTDLTPGASYEVRVWLESPEANLFSVATTAVATPGRAESIAVVHCCSTRPYGEPFTVSVLVNQSGTPVPGIPVTLTDTPVGAAATVHEATTGDNGLATFTLTPVRNGTLTPSTGDLTGAAVAYKVRHKVKVWTKTVRAGTTAKIKVTVWPAGTHRVVLTGRARNGSLINLGARTITGGTAVLKVKLPAKAAYWVYLSVQADTDNEVATSKTRVAPAR